MRESFFRATPFPENRSGPSSYTLQVTGENSQLARFSANYGYSLLIFMIIKGERVDYYFSDKFIFFLYSGIRIWYIS